jgi:hypothetical protein
MKKVTFAVLSATLLLGGCAQNIYNQPAPAKPVISHPTILPPVTTIKPSISIPVVQPQISVPIVKPMPTVPVATISPSVPTQPTVTTSTMTRPQVVNPLIRPAAVVPQQDNSVNGVTSHVVNNLLSSTSVRNLTNNQSPTVWVSNIQNRTSNAINTNVLAHQVQNGLMESGLFSQVNGAKVSQVRQQLGLSSDSQLVERSAAISFGKMIGANFMVYGSVIPSNEANAPYKVTLRLMDLKTGAIEWSGHATHGE